MSLNQVCLHQTSDALIQRYFKDGIYYVKNPNNFPRSRAGLVGHINIPGSIDAVFANGGLTVTGGHPQGLVNRNIARGVFKATDGEGNFLFKIDTLEDLDRKWDKILAGKPDFIKTYLLYSEEYEPRKDDTTYFDWKGLQPEILKEIVRRAHRAGLRVSTHVETGGDFHHAVAAGVDEINHMPGFRPQENVLAEGRLALYEIAEEDARLAGQNSSVVVTTLGGLIRTRDNVDPESNEAAMAAEVRRMTIRNLRLLKKHDVPIAIGSDSYENTSAPEALSLHSLGIFSNLELLKMWCQTTANTIFPERKIGHLKEGYEASFLVLHGNPLADFTNVQKIALRFKQNTRITVKS